MAETQCQHAWTFKRGVWTCMLCWTAQDYEPPPGWKLGSSAAVLMTKILDLAIAARKAIMRTEIDEGDVMHLDGDDWRALAALVDATAGPLPDIDLADFDLLRGESALSPEPVAETPCFCAEEAERWVEYLNSLLEIDPDAIRILFTVETVCNKALAKHPTVQVGRTDPDGPTVVRLLGLLNGYLGVYDDGYRENWGALAANVDRDTGTILHFSILPNKQGK